MAFREAKAVEQPPFSTPARAREPSNVPLHPFPPSRSPRATTHHILLITFVSNSLACFYRFTNAGFPVLPFTLNTLMVIALEYGQSAGCDTNQFLPGFIRLPDVSRVGRR